MRTVSSAGAHFEGAAHVGVRDRVIVQVEAHVGCLGTRTTTRSSQGNGLLATRAAAAAPPRSTRARCGPVLRTRPRRRLPLAPGERLGVEVGDIREAPGGKEALANEADRPLDPALLVAAGHRHRPGLEPIPGGELEQRRMEADGIARALQHGAAKIIVKTDSGHGSEVVEGLRRGRAGSCRWRRSSRSARTDGASTRAPSRRPSAAAVRGRW